MYLIVMDKNTKAFYMKPHEFYFHAFSDREKISDVKTYPLNARFVEVDCETKKELTTILYNAGFTRGYIDEKLTILTKDDAFYYDRNPNELAYAQYLLTDNTSYLENIIDKKKLLTVCKINGPQILFPTIELGNGDNAVLTYTDLSRIPKELFDKYKDFKVVKMSFNAKCVVNDKFIAE